MEKVPFIFIKPKVAFLDDNLDFLMSLKDYFEFDEYFYSTNPRDFIKKINDETLNLCNYLSIDQIDSRREEESIISLDILNTCLNYERCITNEGPYQISFVDFNMPDMNGIKVSEGIYKTSYVCLLTGDLEEKEAIMSFNSGLIKGYIKKQSSRILDDIKSFIVSMEEAYTKYLNKNIESFFQNNNFLQNAFQNKKFVEFYNNLIIENNINFSCIYESYGSMLMKSKNHSYLLNIYPEEELEHIIIPLAEDGSYSRLDEIKRRNLILDYKNISSIKIPPINEWDGLVTLNFSNFSGDEKFYVSFQKT